MSKAQNAMNVLRKNLDFEDMVELIELLASELEKQSQEFMKEAL